MAIQYVNAACHCVGPQNGEPVCPCRMRMVTVEDGKFIERKVLGNVPPNYTKYSDVRTTDTRGENGWSYSSGGLYGRDGDE